MNEIRRLRKQITDTFRYALREAVREAFMEGFEAGADHNNIEWKYPPINIAWRYSDARKDATGEAQPPYEDHGWYKNGVVTDEPEAP
jgi:hypothetical protein